MKFINQVQYKWNPPQIYMLTLLVSEKLTHLYNMGSLTELLTLGLGPLHSPPLFHMLEIGFLSCVLMLLVSICKAGSSALCNVSNIGWGWWWMRELYHLHIELMLSYFIFVEKNCDQNLYVQATLLTWCKSALKVIDNTLKVMKNTLINDREHPQCDG